MNFLVPLIAHALILSVPDAKDPSWEIAREKMKHHQQWVADWNSKNDSIAAVHKNSLVMLVKVTRSDEGLESVVGSGFFLESDFPKLHTAAHVLRGLRLDGGKTFVFFHDRFGIRRRMRLKAADVQFSELGHDHAVIDLSGTEIHRAFPTKYVLKQAQSLPKIAEPTFLNGFRGASIAKVRRNRFRLSQAVYKTAQAVQGAGMAGICLSKADDSPFDETQVLDQLLKQLDPNDQQQWYMNQNQFRVRLAKEIHLDQLLESAMKSEPDFLDYQADDSFCVQDLSMGPGMSGGPVTNDRSEVVGVNSLRMVGAYKGISIIQSIIDSKWKTSERWTF